MMKTYKLLLLATLVSITGIAQKITTPSLVHDICKNCTTTMSCAGMTVFQNKLVFGLGDGIHGMEIWYYDGVDTPKPANRSGSASGLLVFNDKPELNFLATSNMLYYSGGDTSIKSYETELCMWDGINGPTIVKDFMGSTKHLFPHGLSFHNNKIYFGCHDPNGSSTLEAFGIYDITNNKYKYFVPNKGSGLYGQQIKQTIVYKNKIYFPGGGKEGAGLYEYNPTTDTIRKVDPVFNDNREMTTMIIHNDTMYYIGFDSTYGIELRAFTGTDTPYHLTDIIPGYNPSNAQNSIWASIHHDNTLIEYKNKLYFFVYAGMAGLNTKLKLHEYDIATATVKPVTAVDTNIITNGIDAQLLTVYKDKLFLRIGETLYRYDGTNIDTILPLDLKPTIMKEYKGDLYMAATTQQYGFEIYKFVDAPESIQGITFNANIILYPNPTNNNTSISIQLEKAATLSATVTDITGRAVVQTQPTLYSKGKNNIQLQTSRLPAATYIVNIKNKQGALLYSSKLIKQ